MELDCLYLVPLKMFRRGSKKNSEKVNMEENLDRDYETLAKLMELQKPRNSAPSSPKETLTRKQSLLASKLTTGGNGEKRSGLDGKRHKRPSIRRRSTGITQEKTHGHTDLARRQSESATLSKLTNCEIDTKPTDLYRTSSVTSLPPSPKLSSRRKTLSANTDKDIKLSPNDIRIQRLQSNSPCQSQTKLDKVGVKSRSPLMRRHSEVGFSL